MTQKLLLLSIAVSTCIFVASAKNGNSKSTNGNKDNSTIGDWSFYWRGNPNGYGHDHTLKPGEAATNSNQGILPVLSNDKAYSRNYSTHPARVAAASLYKVFEQSFTNGKSYGNKFTDVTLNVIFSHVTSGKTINFWGFYDGNGDGTGDKTNGNIWKVRFMPDKAGTWDYTWSWTDGTPGGKGSFNCVTTGAGKGILKPYQNNPRWFAYNGTDPVYLKSFNVGAAMNHALSWSISKLYQPLINRGYNAFLFYLLLPNEHTDQDYWAGGPISTVPLMRNNDPMSQLSLERWKINDEHCLWLNERNILMFMHGDGFTGKDTYNNCNFNTMNNAQRTFYIKYVMARLAPLQMITWNFTWECDWTWSQGLGDGQGIEKIGMEMIEQYDPWDHLRTAHNGTPDSDDFQPGTYTFAAIESREGHGAQGTADEQRHSSTGEHLIVLDTWGYSNKPVLQQEGHGFWQASWGGNETTVRRCAYGNLTAAGSFVLQGPTSGGGGHGDVNKTFDGQGDEYVDMLTDNVLPEIEFYKMVPDDQLVNNGAFCLKEEGYQYLVYKENGGSFDLKIAAGKYNAKWIDTKTGIKTVIGSVTGNGAVQKFTTPNTASDWVLVLRNAGTTGINEQDKMTHITISPNPSRDEVYISWSEISIHKIEIFNLIGEQVGSYDLMEAHKTIKLQGLSKGTYLIRFTSQSGFIQNRKIIIQH